MDKEGSVVISSVARKDYSTPSLVRGPVLAKVSAETTSPPPAKCWVARAAFGEADIRWMIFRAWLVEDAPVWFRRLYLRRGESFGHWLAGRAGARRVVRSLMIPAVRRKLKG